MKDFDAQLAGWRESHNGGFVASFWFADSDDAREYLGSLTERKGKQAGQLLRMTLEQMDEHGNAPEPPRKFKGGPIARLLILDWCKNPLFQEWLGVVNEDAAALKVKMICGVESRNQIDDWPVATMKFHKEIREPYKAWLDEQDAK